MNEEPLSFQFDGIEVSPATFTIRQGPERLEFEPKATRVLLYLIRHRERVVTKDELVQEVWDGTAVTDNAVTRVIAQLRKGLSDDPKSPKYIETLPTMGYRFIAEVTELRDSTVLPPALPEHLERVEPQPPPVKRRGLVVGLAAATIVPAAWWTFRRASSSGASTNPEKRNAVQITLGTGFNGRPSFGPDGKQFVFCSNRNGRFELYLSSMSADRGTQQLTNDGQQNIHPAWSPDGKWIAYHSSARRGIWIIPAAGGNPRQLSAFGSTPAWSPDSKTIAFSSMAPFSLAPFDMGDQGTIWMTALDGSSTRQLSAFRTPRGNHAAPCWNPDGKSLVFVALSRDSALHILDIASGQTKPLMQIGVDIPRQPGSFASRIWDPVYHPSNGKIYFSASGANGEASIWSIPAAGGDPLRVFTTGTDTPTGLTISPHGQHLLMTRNRTESRLITQQENGEIRTLFQGDLVRASVPNYSHDGNWLAFGVEREGRNRDLWLMRMDKGDAFPITEESGAKEWGGIWTTSGEVLYNYVEGRMMEFRAYHPDTRQSRVIHRRALDQLHRPYLLPNGKDLLCSCSSPWNVCLGPVTDAMPKQITNHRYGAWFAVPDRTGQWLAYEVVQGEVVQLWVMRRDGSQAELLVDGEVSWPNVFSADGKRIAYSSMKNGVWNLWSVDRFSKERTQLTHRTAFGSFVRTPTWRPGTKELSFESFEVRGNIYALDL